MIRFAEVFPDQPIVSTLSRQLGWSHFVEIIPLKDDRPNKLTAGNGPDDPDSLACEASDNIPQIPAPIPHQQNLPNSSLLRLNFTPTSLEPRSPCCHSTFRKYGTVESGNQAAPSNADG
jgi:hypothetical protein